MRLATPGEGFAGLTVAVASALLLAGCAGSSAGGNDGNDRPDEQGPTNPHSAIGTWKPGELPPGRWAQGWNLSVPARWIALSFPAVDSRVDVYYRGEFDATYNRSDSHAMYATYRLNDARLVGGSLRGSFWTLEEAMAHESVDVVAESDNHVRLRLRSWGIGGFLGPQHGPVALGFSQPSGLDPVFNVTVLSGARLEAAIEHGHLAKWLEPAAFEPGPGAGHLKAQVAWERPIVAKAFPEEGDFVAPGPAQSSGPQTQPPYEPTYTFRSADRTSYFERSGQGYRNETEPMVTGGPHMVAAGPISLELDYSRYPEEARDAVHALVLPVPLAHANATLWPRYA